MQSRTIGVIVVVGVICLAIGASSGYYLSSQNGSTITFTKTPSVTTTTQTTSLLRTTTETTTLVSLTTSLETLTQTSISSSKTTSTSISCTVSYAATGSYVTVMSDDAQPIQGVQVSGILVTQIENGGTCQQNIGTFVTNSTGTALITQTAGSYYLLTMLYLGVDYTATAPIKPFQSTYVILKVPSGNVSVSEIPYGGCVRNATGTLCPG